MDICWKNSSFEPNDEDSAPAFAFKNVAFDQRCTGSQLEYVSILNLPFIKKQKFILSSNRVNKSFFKHLIHNCRLGAVKIVRNSNARNAWKHNDGTLARNVIMFVEKGNNNFFIIESGPAQFV